MFTPLLVSYRARQIQKSGEDLIREQFWAEQPIKIPENEAPNWIPYSCVEQLQCVVHFFSLAYSVGLPKLVVSLLTRTTLLGETEILLQATKNSPGNLMGQVHHCMINTDEL